MDNKTFRGLSVVIFGYNECGTLQQTVEKSLLVIKKMTRDGELIIVDDGSTDETKHLLIKLEVMHPQIVIHRFEKNRGIGEALKTGYRLSTKDFVCAIPADCH